MEADLVSVVLPTYNRQGTLGRAIRSILQQTYTNLELLVIDDGSTDDTPSVIAQFDDPRLRYIQMPDNRGQSRGRNVGISMAKGAYIAFQDSDDEWLDGKLLKAVDAAKASGQEDVAVFHSRVVYGISSSLKYEKHNVSIVPLLPDNPSQDDFKTIIKSGNIISPQTLFFSRKTLEKIGPFDETIATSVDWDFAIKLIHNAYTIFIDEPLVMAYIQDDSIQRARRKSVRSRLRIALRLGRRYEVKPAVMAHHLGGLGMSVAKYGKPLGGRRIIRRAVRLDPTNGKNWARLAVTECLALALPITSRIGWRVWR